MVRLERIGVMSFLFRSSDLSRAMQQPRKAHAVWRARASGIAKSDTTAGTRDWEGHLRKYRITNTEATTAFAYRICAISFRQSAAIGARNRRLRITQL